MMKVYLAVALALVAQVVAFEPINLRYHETVGIPAAARIKAAEETADFDGSRIWGGQSTGLGDVPHIGGLLVLLSDGRTSVCGSTLLTNTKLVTAAHCWAAEGTFRPVSLEVVLGSVTLFSGGTRVTTTEVELHQNYNAFTLQNDIGIITIPFTAYTDTIKPVTLPSSFLLWFTFEGNWAQAAGFGRTSDTNSITTAQTLSHASLQVISNLECASVYGFAVIDSTLCTSGIFGSNTCGGDSGGPLTLSLSGDTVLIGVTSFSSASGCTTRFPGGFARVTSFINWINARI